MAQKYGYIWVSAHEQDEDSQLAALADCKIPEENIYADRQRDKDTRRSAYMELRNRLQQGDILVIKSLDDLGSDYDEIVEQWRIITKEIHANIRVLDMPLLDTSIPRGESGTLTADLVYEVLSHVAKSKWEENGDYYFT